MALKKILVVVVALAVCGPAAPFFAQSDRAAIVGTVKDSSSAVLPGVAVRVTDVGTGAVQAAMTDTRGYYRVDNLPIGSYTVTFERGGFKSLEREGITLLISQVAEIDATLQVT